MDMLIIRKYWEAVLFKPSMFYYHLCKTKKEYLKAKREWFRDNRDIIFKYRMM